MYVARSGIAGQWQLYVSLIEELPNYSLLNVSSLQAPLAALRPLWPFLLSFPCESFVSSVPEIIAPPRAPSFLPSAHSILVVLSCGCTFQLQGLP